MLSFDFYLHQISWSEDSQVSAWHPNVFPNGREFTISTSISSHTDDPQSSTVPYHFCICELHCDVLKKVQPHEHTKNKKKEGSYAFVLQIKVYIHTIEEVFGITLPSSRKSWSSMLLSTICMFGNKQTKEERNKK